MIGKFKRQSGHFMNIKGRVLVHQRERYQLSLTYRGWSGGAMVLGNLPVPWRPTIWMIVGQGPTVLAVGAGGGCLDIFLSSITSLFFLPLSGRRPDID